jgi:hypothetical protein
VGPGSATHRCALHRARDRKLARGGQKISALLSD